jgi:hypothetical protein
VSRHWFIDSDLITHPNPNIATSTRKTKRGQGLGLEVDGGIESFTLHFPTTSPTSRNKSVLLLASVLNSEAMGETSINGKSAADPAPNGCSRRLTDDEFDRYSRQMIVPGMGKEGKFP